MIGDEGRAAARRRKLAALMHDATETGPVRDVHDLAVEGDFKSDEEIDKFIAAVHRC